MELGYNSSFQDVPEIETVLSEMIEKKIALEREPLNPKNLTNRGRQIEF
jgi:hypothetical protein